MGTIKAVCTSTIKGIQKSQTDSVELRPNWGIADDAHAGNWHRQVSLLSKEQIDAFRARGADVEAGSFGENIVAEGFDFARLPVGTLLRCGEAVLGITQIGKECHEHCAIYASVGDCIMPREGVFARVIHGGTVHAGDELVRLYRAAVITVSDRSSTGEREDASGPLIVKMLEADGRYAVVKQTVVPDDRPGLEKLLRQIADDKRAELILTTGSTGFSPRDIAPDATMAVCERNAPGIAEAMRAYSLKITPRAMLSRAVSVIREATLIVNLPGSPKACKENLEYILPTLPHGLDVLSGSVSDCSR